GDYAGALVNYEKGITNDPKTTAHDDLCVAGMARASLYTGDMRSPDKQLKKDCATILDNLKLFNEAGALYEQAECWEEAATAFIKIKN
uniref:Uncharacterized protein n=1 Tax=Amphimedon queenslandica TaxID=400682 RepID=A0A1X7TH28_AMPQE